MNHAIPLSIIILVYKVEQYLGQCIENHKKNGGLGDARNNCIELASGIYLMFLGSDDWIKNDSLAEVLTLVQNTDVDVIINHYEVYKEFNDGIIWKPKQFDINKINGKSPLTCIDYFSKTGIIPPACNYITRKNLLFKKGLFFLPGILHEDVEWVPRLLCSAASFWLYEKPYYIYRFRAGSITTAKTIKNLKDELLIIEKLSSYPYLTIEKEKKYFLSMTIYWRLYPIYHDFNKFTKPEKLIIEKWSKQNRSLEKAVLKYNSKIYFLTYFAWPIYTVIFFMALVTLIRKKNEHQNNT